MYTLFFILSSLMASSAFAATDYSALTAAVDVAAVTSAIMAVAALMMNLVVARWGARKILGFFR